MPFDPNAYLRGEPQPDDLPPLVIPPVWTALATHLEETFEIIELRVGDWRTFRDDPQYGPTSPWGVAEVRRHFFFVSLAAEQLRVARRQLGSIHAPEPMRREVHEWLVWACWLKRDLFKML